MSTDAPSREMWRARIEDMKRHLSDLEHNQDDEAKAELHERLLYQASGDWRMVIPD